MTILKVFLLVLLGLTSNAVVYDKTKLTFFNKLISEADADLTRRIQLDCSTACEEVDGRQVCHPSDSCIEMHHLRQVQAKEYEVTRAVTKACDEYLAKLDLGRGNGVTTSRADYKVITEQRSANIKLLRASKIESVTETHPLAKKIDFCVAEIQWLSDLNSAILYFQAEVLSDAKCDGAKATELYILQDIGKPMKPVVDRLKKELKKYLTSFSIQAQTKLKVGLGVFTGSPTAEYPNMSVFTNILRLTSDLDQLQSAYNNLELIDRSSATNTTVYETINKSVQSDSGVGWGTLKGGEPVKSLHRYILLLSDRNPLVAQEDLLASSRKTLDHYLMTVMPTRVEAGIYGQLTWSSNMADLQVARAAKIFMIQQSCQDNRIRYMAGRDVVAMAYAVDPAGVSCTGGTVCDAGMTTGFCKWDDTTVCVCAEGHVNSEDRGCVVDCSSCNGKGKGYEDDKCTRAEGGEVTCTCSADYVNTDASTCALNCSACKGNGYEDDQCTKVGDGQLTCTCSSGYTNTAPITCTKGDKCTNPCGTKGYSGTCSTVDNIEMCNCADGFVNTKVDECIAKVTSCDPNLCPKSTPGYTGACEVIDAKSYSCSCTEDHQNVSDDKTKCVALDCSSCKAGTAGYKGSCKIPNGKLTCDCTDGYTNNATDALTCEDACAGQCAGEGVNGCTTSGLSPRCVCKSGYTLSSAFVCTEGDPCKDLVCTKDAGHTGQCENRRGIASCVCTEYYNNGSDPKTCVSLTSTATPGSSVNSGGASVPTSTFVSILLFYYCFKG